MRNQWIFNASQLSEIEVVNRAVSDWQEYREMLPHQKARPPLHHTTPQPRPISSLSQPPVVGSCTLATSSIFKRHSPQTTTGIIAFGPHGKPQHAKVNVWLDKKDLNRLALEAVRDAQLLAYQFGWRKVIIQNDVHDVVDMLLKKQNFTSELATIANDIFLLTNLFDDCHFSFINRQDNKLCRKLAFHGLEFPFSVTWDSTLHAWLLEAA